MTPMEMRNRCLAAVGAGVAMAACPSTAPVTANAERVDSRASASTVPAPAREQRAAPADDDARCPSNAPKQAYCLAPFTQPPANIPPVPLPFDSRGCLARRDFHDSCGGVREVLEGPRFEHGQCCFTVCQGTALPCGRPLLDERSHARLALSVPRRDWQVSLAVRASPIASRLRDEWLADGAAEHASIAAFARFTLELLAVGAPVALVEQSQRAGQDEIAHARVCFALASAYGAEVGPGPLPLVGIRLREDLVAVAASTVVEGCVGETYAALCAQEARATCIEPVAAMVLDQIAGDEARHAALAWQFVAWAIDKPGVRPAVEDAFTRALAAAPAVGPEDVDGLREAGRLRRIDRVRVWRASREDVILPCLRVLRRAA